MDKKTNDEKRPYGVLNADCLEAMKKLPDNFIDAVVTDPPYGLSFMGKDWDHGVPGVAFWKEALRITKPGGHIVAFGGSRTYHRLTCAIEDAGWEIRDCLGWLYSSGFPKSMDISKAIDKKLGAERNVIGKNTSRHGGGNGTLFGGGIGPETGYITEPSSEEAKKWSGWGTCLKPAFEPIVLARKPVEGTVADNVMKYGVGGINIDECRVPSDEPVVVHSPAKKTLYDSGHKDKGTWVDTRGRFPANIIHDGSEEVLDAFDNRLKPSFEPIVLARKPVEGTVADNVLKYGVGGINIDECRVPTDEVITTHSNSKEAQDNRTIYGKYSELETHQNPGQRLGRFPANIIHDGSEEVRDVLDNKLNPDFEPIVLARKPLEHISARAMVSSCATIFAQTQVMGLQISNGMI